VRGEASPLYVRGAIPPLWCIGGGTSQLISTLCVDAEV